MTLAQFKCGLGCGWITYDPDLYGIDGPVPLHVLTHHSNEEGAVNAPLTVGHMAGKGANTVAPTHTVQMTVEERWDRLQEALRIKERALALQSVLEHYTAMAVEAMSDPMVSIPSSKLDALLLDNAELRAVAPPATTGWSEMGAGNV